MSSTISYPLVVASLIGRGLKASEEFPGVIHVAVPTGGELVCGFANGPLGCDHQLGDGLMGESFESKSIENQEGTEDAAAGWIFSKCEIVRRIAEHEARQKGGR